MRLNYSIDHRLLASPVFEGVRGNERRALLITLSVIVHFTKNTKIGQCQFYQKQMALDWDMSERYFRDALRKLQKIGYIKCIKPYDRKSLTPGVYVAKIATKPTKPVAMASTGSSHGVSNQ